MPLMHDQIDDFVTLTLSQELRREWTDISLPLQRYIFAEKALKGPLNQLAGRIKYTMKGQSLRFRIQHDTQGKLQDSELYAIESPTVKDQMTKGVVEWSKQTNYLVYDIDEEEFQGGFEELADIIEVRKNGVYGSFFEGMETRMWTGPTSSTQSPRKPLGIPHWIQKATSPAFDFQGGNPSGFSAGAAGVDSNTYPHWKNGAALYASVSEDDLFDLLDEAMDKCEFRPPHPFPQLDKGSPDWSLYTVYSVTQECKKILRASNDNIGRDVGMYRDKVLFRGIPLEWVPALDNTSSDAYDSSNPIYGINWNTFGWKFDEQRKMQWTKPKSPANQPTVRVSYLINWGQFLCINRRANFVISLSS